MMIYVKIKRKIFSIIEKGSINDKASVIFDHFIITLIILNVMAIVLESFQGLYNSNQILFYRFELISVIIFTIEYILRVWTAEFKYPSKSKIYSKVYYLFSPLAVIDLLAIVPFFLPLIIPFDLRFLRIMRLTRLLRVLKLNRYSSAMQLVGEVLKEKKEELMVTFFITFILLLVASSLMFYIEHDAQPEAFPNIIASFWWAIATLTTVGYGDVYPITGWGRLLSGIIAVLGIGLVALPTGIISSGFMNRLAKDTKHIKDTNDPNFCPHCGKKLKH